MRGIKLECITTKSPYDPEGALEWRWSFRVILLKTMISHWIRPGEEEAWTWVTRLLPAEGNFMRGIHL